MGAAHPEFTWKVGLVSINDVHWVSAARTDVGKVRKLNEDAFLELPDNGIWSVADGMGGHHAGDYASTQVVETLSEVAAGDSIGAVAGEVVARLEAVNERLYHEGQARKSIIIGCTVVALLGLGRHAAVIWAGDSRAYRLREGSLEQLTRDHSRIQALIERGVISAREAESHPEANVITRAVGVAERIELDTEVLQVKDGDTFLLCSDGLSRFVTDDEFLEVLNQSDCERACEELLRRALASSARDNITVIVARAQLDDTAVPTQINPTGVSQRDPHDDDPTVINRELPGDDQG